VSGGGACVGVGRKRARGGGRNAPPTNPPGGTPAHRARGGPVRRGREKPTKIRRWYFCSAEERRAGGRRQSEPASNHDALVHILQVLPQPATHGPGSCGENVTAKLPTYVGEDHLNRPGSGEGGKSANRTQRARTLCEAGQAGGRGRHSRARRPHASSRASTLIAGGLRALQGGRIGKGPLGLRGGGLFRRRRRRGARGRGEEEASPPRRVSHVDTKNARRNKGHKGAVDLSQGTAGGPPGSGPCGR